MSRKLFSMAKSSKLMRVSVKYQGERIVFNLYEESIISEDRLNSEVTEQPSIFGFLTLLQKKLIRKQKDMEIEKNSTWGKLYDKYKLTRGEDGKALNNDHVEAKIKCNPEYIAICKDCNDIEEQVGTINSCVETFNQRSFLIQTISANVRKSN